MKLITLEGSSVVINTTYILSLSDLYPGEESFLKMHRFYIITLNLSVLEMGLGGDGSPEISKF